MCLATHVSRDYDEPDGAQKRTSWAQGDVHGMPRQTPEIISPEAITESESVAPTNDLQARPTDE